MKSFLLLAVAFVCSAASAQTVRCPTTTGSPYTIGGPWKCQQARSFNPGTNTWSVAFNSNVTSGNLLIVDYFFGLSTANFTSIVVSGSRNGTFTCGSVVGPGNFSPSHEYDGVCYKVATSSGSETITATPTCSGGCTVNGFAGGDIAEISDSSGTPAFDAFFTSINGSAASGTCPCSMGSITATASATNDLGFLAVDTANGAPDAPNYMTLDSVAMAWAGGEAMWVQNASSSGTMTMTGNDTTASDPVILAGIAFKASNASSSVPNQFPRVQ